MLEQEVTDDELARMVNDGFGDYCDPRFPALILILARKGILSVADIQELIRCGEPVAVS
ncbi:hypothetical protein HY732_03805 [Candidatus Uhrbacteria bacterium]|nr:hypothetical protein [Candidatus Uhrbacteria bacterium]